MDKINIYLNEGDRHLTIVLTQDDQAAFYFTIGSLADVDAFIEALQKSRPHLQKVLEN